MDEVMSWLTFYNHRRLHLTLSYVSPMKFEQRWIAAQQEDRKCVWRAALCSADNRGEVNLPWLV